MSDDDTIRIPDRPVPRAMRAAAKHLDAAAGTLAVELLRDLAATLQHRMTAAIGLIDSGNVTEARALLDAQVIALDALDVSPVRQR